MGIRVNTSEAVRTLLSRSWFAQLMGWQMNGKRNMYETFGWKTRPQHLDFVMKYRRQDITKRVIDAPVNALWSDPPVITGDDVFQKAWSDLLADCPVFYNLQRLDKLAGLGAFAIMVIGINDSAKLDQPITRKEGRKILYMQPYPEGAITIESYDENPQSPRYGLPLMYTVNPGQFDTSSGMLKRTAVDRQSFKVHWSRVLHIAENALENEAIGYSRLEPIYNALDDLQKVAGGAAEMYWLAGNRGLHVDVDKDMELEKEDAENLAEEIDEYSNNLRRVIRTRGVSVNSLGAETTDPRGTFDVILSLIASCTGIPKRVLAGSEAGQLASQQDRANWAQRVAERITEYGQPIVLIPFIRRLIDIGVLPAPSRLSIEWPDAFKMNPLERAQTSAQMARSAANLSKTLKTVADINHQNALDSQPTTISQGSGFSGNATPPEQSSGSEGEAKLLTQPALYKVPPPKLELLTVDECRSIIGFGKHMPVFDEKSDSQTNYSSSSEGGE